MQYPSLQLVCILSLRQLSPFEYFQPIFQLYIAPLCASVFIFIFVLVSILCAAFTSLCHEHVNKIQNQICSSGRGRIQQKQISIPK